MPVNRDKAAADLYRVSVRGARKEMIMFSQCDEGRDVGLLRAYMASDQAQLARIRRRNAVTRGDKVKRKADFYAVLARMAERLDRLTCGF
ncbi:hypothetical protein PHIM7_305 [Sinorhizobium phage phiM7]|uniref:Uncharacterized protein n=3 Tax=Emdodecavirus TaxID=1980937 RepID=S5MVV6_9CAUD|nr:hypothetical protein AB690_gp206 [Sinorhizobium phage phiM12]YP_009212549.1 hypothetical protein AVT40_gp224 [Sinorhizobium phage phiN3]YP_009601430.1 hypothetical protein FDH46_gp173 [Sinorhizobium phage phiM7]AKF13210.1 hypothetical protein PHIM19_305 [Sinorhizobium phage phiM19]AGR48027.1 hypothetical protein SmphiM12_395 [Sinorhizobium phage phiM12]AKF12851.1 hypothetical protein PHIM7_305 [Sinorhizobium phage phiM7]AKF13572.1 hypothetical protein PHIN3_309 [Sinorhizobium phage phiN3]